MFRVMFRHDKVLLRHDKVLFFHMFKDIFFTIMNIMNIIG